MGWHLDVGPGFGNGEVRTAGGDPRQGVILLVLLSDCSAGGGGTALLPGSHRWVQAEVERAARAGEAPHTHESLNAWCVARLRALTEGGRVLLPGCHAGGGGGNGDGDTAGGGGGGDGGCGETGAARHLCEQVTGAAGDVILLHPLLLHSGTANASRAPRLMLNGMAVLTEEAFAARGHPLLRAMCGGAQDDELHAQGSIAEGTG